MHPFLMIFNMGQIKICLFNISYLLNNSHAFADLKNFMLRKNR